MCIRAIYISEWYVKGYLFLGFGRGRIEPLFCLFSSLSWLFAVDQKHRKFSMKDKTLWKTKQKWRTKKRSCLVLSVYIYVHVVSVVWFYNLTDLQKKSLPFHMFYFAHGWFMCSFFFFFFIKKKKSFLFLSPGKQASIDKVSILRRLEPTSIDRVSLHREQSVSQFCWIMSF